MQTRFETDWLNSRTVFFNDRTKEISHNINDLIGIEDIEFHPEGLKNYLDFGYSVFGQTPLKNIKFLDACQEISKVDKELVIVNKTDPTVNLEKYIISEDEIVHKVKVNLNNSINEVNLPVILPLSGGFDSKLLAFLIENKNNVNCFTYGVSNNQSQSFEVTRAKMVANLLKLSWSQIQLSNIHNYLDDWNLMFGCSTHAHGMYQMSFYERIFSQRMPKGHVISGIMADLWAGSIKAININSMHDLQKLGYNHEMNADISFYKLNFNEDVLERKWIESQDRFKDELFQQIEIARIKIILLSYLLRVPESLGFKVSSPFLDPEICLGMLMLPNERRIGREWQREFFEKENLMLKTKSENNTNLLSHYSLKEIPVTPLDSQLLSELFDKKYIDFINDNVRVNTLRYLIARGLKKRYLWRVLRAIGMRDKVIKAYNAYLTLKPIENLLRLRSCG